MPITVRRGGGGGGGASGEGLPATIAATSTATIENPISGVGDLTWATYPVDTPFAAFGEAGDTHPRIWYTPRGMLITAGDNPPYTNGEPYVDVYSDGGWLSLRGYNGAKVEIEDVIIRDVALGNGEPLTFTFGVDTFALTVNGDGQLLLDGQALDVSGGKVTSPIGADYFLQVTDDGVLHTGTPPASGGSAASFASTYKFGVDL